MNPRLELLRALREAHTFILTAGGLGILSVLTGLLTSRTGAPVLLVFLGVGMLAGEDGPVGIPFDDFNDAYLIGSLALAVILFQGGVKTSPRTVRRVFWPASILATVGVAVTAAIVGGTMSLLAGAPLAGACLAGAIVAPTDAAAVSLLLRRSGAAVPERLMELLEVESGLNDPMSVFLTFTLLRSFVPGLHFSLLHALGTFARDMFGGAVIGLAAGSLLAFGLRRLRLEPAFAHVLALAGALTTFGAAQLLDTSGFLATYLAGVAVNLTDLGKRRSLDTFFDGMGWLAQISLFVMLGLLVTPHELAPFVLPAIVGTIILIFVARPVSVFLCLAPFGFRARESAFASWVGLRGGVPIYLSFIPALADPTRDRRLFCTIFIVVVASLIVQGWTVSYAAGLLGFRQRSLAPADRIVPPA